MGQFYAPHRQLRRWPDLALRDLTQGIESGRVQIRGVKRHAERRLIRTAARSCWPATGPGKACWPFDRRNLGSRRTHCRKCSSSHEGFDRGGASLLFDEAVVAVEEISRGRQTVCGCGDDWSWRCEEIGFHRLAGSGALRLRILRVEPLLPSAATTPLFRPREALT